jgi:two-component system OmpR family response regulator
MEKTAKKIRLFLVDDDALFLKSLEIDFQGQADFEIETFATGELCIANLSKNPDVVILDFHLNGIDQNAINGLDTLVAIKEYNVEIPVIMLSSQDKIDIAIKCMHHNAFDYVVKSETAFVRLQKNISTIFSDQKIKKELNWYMDRM